VHSHAPTFVANGLQPLPWVFQLQQLVAGFDLLVTGCAGTFRERAKFRGLGHFNSKNRLWQLLNGIYSPEKGAGLSLKNILNTSLPGDFLQISFP
jgi:hypothetical protein